MTKSDLKEDIRILLRILETKTLIKLLDFESISHTSKNLVKEILRYRLQR
jgi:hypothetical protein